MPDRRAACAPTTGRRRRPGCCPSSPARRTRGRTGQSVRRVRHSGGGIERSMGPPGFDEPEEPRELRPRLVIGALHRGSRRSRRARRAAAAHSHILRVIERTPPSHRRKAVAKRRRQHPVEIPDGRVSTALVLGPQRLDVCVRAVAVSDRAGHRLDHVKRVPRSEKREESSPMIVEGRQLTRVRHSAVTTAGTACV